MGANSEHGCLSATKSVGIAVRKERAIASFLDGAVAFPGALATWFVDEGVYPSFRFVGGELHATYAEEVREINLEFIDGCS